MAINNLLFCLPLNIVANFVHLIVLCFLVMVLCTVMTYGGSTGTYGGLFLGIDDLCGRNLYSWRRRSIFKGRIQYHSCVVPSGLLLFGAL
jgi:hypothetical protein